jgi:hypothetical protein
MIPNMTLCTAEGVVEAKQSGIKHERNVVFKQVN